MATAVSPQTASRMATTFHRYRECMIASDLAQVIDSLNLRPSRAIRRLFGTVPTIVYKLESFETPRAAAEEIPDTDLDGVFLSPVSAEKREEFLTRLWEKVNGYMQEQQGSNSNDSDGAPLGLPEEYMALLQHCDALVDPDLRVIDVGGLYGTWCIWPEYEIIPEIEPPALLTSDYIRGSFRVKFPG